MNPITATEITFSAIFVIVIFVISLLTPSNVRKLSLTIALLLTILLVLYFVIRPYWVENQVSKKMEQLNQYLMEKYPNQEWTISRQEGRQYNPYHLDVVFENETGWTYTYSVKDEKNICQNVWTSPEGEFPDEGKHFERNHCE